MLVVLSTGAGVMSTGAGPAGAAWGAISIGAEYEGLITPPEEPLEPWYAPPDEPPQLPPELPPELPPDEPQ